jgi:Tfp pilus assembly protein PilO
MNKNINFVCWWPMLKTFKRISARKKNTRSAAQIYLFAALCMLATLNAAALYFIVKPPGGSREDLSQARLEAKRRLKLAGGQLLRLRAVSDHVKTGTTQVSEFEAHYVLVERTAYAQILEEIARIAQATGIEEDDAVFTEEPIEGTADLSVLNMTANYRGSYEKFMRFLHEVDLSPTLLILDNLQASPREKSGEIRTSIRFQAIVREDSTALGAIP